SDDPRLLFFGFPLGIEKSARRISVTMRPAIYGDGFDIARRIEAGVSQHARELIANVALELLEGRAHQLDAAGAELVTHRKSRPARCPQHKQDGWLFRL